MQNKEYIYWNLQDIVITLWIKCDKINIVKDRLAFIVNMECNADEEDKICNPVLVEDEFVLITKSDIFEQLNNHAVYIDKNESANDIDSNDQLSLHGNENHTSLDDDTIENQIIQVEKEFEHWTKLRRDTILKLREIAEYIGK